MQKLTRGKIAIYRAKNSEIQLKVKFEEDSIWITQKQIAYLFGTQRPAITKHLHNIFKSKELEENSVCSILEHTARDGKKYKTKFYNLDVIISVGYRVNSTRATQFRIWATNILKQYLIEGYALNERRLQEQVQKFQSLQNAILLIGTVKAKKELDYNEAMGLLAIINDYSYALRLLDDYDNKNLKISQISVEEKFRITYEDAVNAIRQLKLKFAGHDLFGVERDQSFRSSIGSVYQTFDGKDLYPSIEEKAANLLYFIVKNHSFIDGNKRIAVSIFLWLLERNGLLYKADGSKRLADNALVALTLMIAESDPIDRDVIITLVVNLINKNN